MSKFNIDSLKSKFNVASLKARFKSVGKDRTRIFQLAAVAVLVIFLLWFLNYLLDGALLTALLLIVFVVGFCALIFACAPEQFVAFVEQVIEGSKAHWARLKRSIKKLRELLTKKSPEVVVDAEVVTPASAPSPAPATVVPVSEVSTPKPSKTRTPAVPVPVKTSPAVAGGPDALGKVAAATRRRPRTLSMPGEGEDKS